VNYYLAIRGEQSGPFALDDVLAMWNQGAIPPDSFYYHEGLSDWQSIQTLIANQSPPVAAASSPQARPRARQKIVLAAGIALLVLAGIMVLLRQQGRSSLPVESIVTTDSVTQTKTIPAVQTPAPRLTRFSDDALEFLRGTSGAYQLDGVKTVPPRPDTNFLARLAKSSDRDIHIAATTMLQINALASITAEGHRQIQDALVGKAVQLEWSSVLWALNGDQPTIETTSAEVQQVLGPLKNAQNELQAIHIVRNSMVTNLAGRIAQLADRTDPKLSAARPLSEPSLCTNSADLGFLVLTNHTGRTQHHCLVITRVVHDPAKRAKDNQTERGLHFGLPFLGVDPEMVEQAHEAWELQKRNEGIGTATIVYVPEIAPGQVLRVLAAEPWRLSLAAEIHCAFWSNESAGEHLLGGLSALQAQIDKQKQNTATLTRQQQIDATRAQRGMLTNRAPNAPVRPRR
jgi:hypothetical protein